LVAVELNSWCIRRQLFTSQLLIVELEMATSLRLSLSLRHPHKNTHTHTHTHAHTHTHSHTSVLTNTSCMTQIYYNGKKAQHVVCHRQKCVEHAALDGTAQKRQCKQRDNTRPHVCDHMTAVFLFISIPDQSVCPSVCLSVCLFLSLRSLKLAIFCCPFSFSHSLSLSLSLSLSRSLLLFSLSLSSSLSNACSCLLLVCIAGSPLHSLVWILT